MGQTFEPRPCEEFMFNTVGPDNWLTVCEFPLGKEVKHVERGWILASIWNEGMCKVAGRWRLTLTFRRFTDEHKRLAEQN